MHTILAKGSSGTLPIRILVPGTSETQIMAAAIEIAAGLPPCYNDLVLFDGDARVCRLRVTHPVPHVDVVRSQAYNRGL